jgi:hypothetical protein
LPDAAVFSSIFASLFVTLAFEPAAALVVLPVEIVDPVDLVDDVVSVDDVGLVAPVELVVFVPDSPGLRRADFALGAAFVSAVGSAAGASTAPTALFSLLGASATSASLGPLARPGPHLYELRSIAPCRGSASLAQLSWRYVLQLFVVNPAGNRLYSMSCETGSRGML